MLTKISKCDILLSFKEEGCFSPVGQSLDCVQIRFFLKWFFLEQVKITFFVKFREFYEYMCIRTNMVKWRKLN